MEVADLRDNLASLSELLRDHYVKHDSSVQQDEIISVKTSHSHSSFPAEWSSSQLNLIDSTLTTFENDSHRNLYRVSTMCVIWYLF